VLVASAQWLGPAKRCACAMLNSRAGDSESAYERSNTMTAIVVVTLRELCLALGIQIVALRRWAPRPWRRSAQHTLATTSAHLKRLEPASRTGLFSQSL